MPSGVQGAADGLPVNTETGRHRKTAQALLALRRSTVTPTEMRARAVVLNSLPPPGEWANRLSDFAASAATSLPSSSQAANTATHLGHFRSHRPGLGTSEVSRCICC